MLDAAIYFHSFRIFSAASSAKNFSEESLVLTVCCFRPLSPLLSDLVLSSLSSRRFSSWEAEKPAQSSLLKRFAMPNDRQKVRFSSLAVKLSFSIVSNGFYSVSLRGQTDRASGRATRSDFTLNFSAALRQVGHDPFLVCACDLKRA